MGAALLSEMRFDRQIQTMRPATAGKRLENEINQWLSRRRFTALRWSWETGPGTPLGAPETVTALTLAYAETGDPEAAHRYQVKAFLPPPAGPGGSPSVPPLPGPVARRARPAGGEV